MKRYTTEYTEKTQRNLIVSFVKTFVLFVVKKRRENKRVEGYTAEYTKKTQNQNFIRIFRIIEFAE